MKVIAAHLLNDYSGSPKVLMQLLKGWVQNNYTVQLHTCKNKDGFLSNLSGVDYHFFSYTWAANPFIRLINLVWSQCILFIHIMTQAHKEDIVYINTVLPFGAAIAGKLKGCSVIYHVHETSVKPPFLKTFLFKMIYWCATDVIYVSNYLSQSQPFPTKNTHILYNAIENSFLTKAQTISIKSSPLHNILMVCSLKIYKGVHEYVTLAHQLPHHSFKLVLNASQTQINEFFKNVTLPHNLMVYDTQKEVQDFYKWADLVLNLSHTDAWIETFGLTIIEGMAYGNPAIVPPIGGITEVITPGKNGAHMASSELNSIMKQIQDWTENTPLYNLMRYQARETLSQFNEKTFIAKSIKVLNLVQKKT